MWLSCVPRDPGPAVGAGEGAGVPARGVPGPLPRVRAGGHRARRAARAATQRLRDAQLHPRRAPGQLLPVSPHCSREGDQYEGDTDSCLKLATFKELKKNKFKF